MEPMELSELLTERLVSADLKATDKLAVLDELSQLLAGVHDELNADVVARALLDREGIMSTAVGHGVAIPHAKTCASPTGEVYPLPPSGANRSYGTRRI